MLIVLVCVSGCGRETTVRGITSSGSSWTATTTDSTPGIDTACVTFITLEAGPPEGVPFVVWSDLSSGGGSGSSTATSASFRGHHRGHGNRRVDFHVETTDGQTGTITIAGVAHDLGKGSLFLISTQHDPPKVAQIDFDMNNFPDGKEHLINLANSSQDIRTFFEKHNSKDDGDE